ncbi:MAG: glutamate racemase [Clostridia bacterium]|nr:glutamate racemase [Clostridia bacterium]
MSDNRPIGVFDSGLGGLTVVRALKQYLPNEDIVYFGDTGRVPYGTRSNDIVKKYAREDEAFLLSQNVKMIIAACGTVSSVAYMTADELPVPFFEVVTPAAKAAAKATKKGRVGVLGTPVTVKSRSHARAILNLLPDAVIVANSCPLFVPLVEEGWISADDNVTFEVAKRYLEPIKQGDVDTLILGCTHYPALKGTIARVMGDGVTLIDPSVATATSVKEYLKNNNMLNENGGKYKYFVSDRPDSFSKTAKILMGESLELDVSQVDIFDYIQGK